MSIGHTSLITELPNSKAGATAAGLKYFYTGRPCIRGHVAKRKVANGTCSKCLLEKHNTRRQNGYVWSGTKVCSSKYYLKNRDKFLLKARQQRLRDPKRYWAVNAASAAKKRANYLGLPFDIDADYVVSILTDKCPVFGTVFKYHGNGVGNKQSATLDRLKPKLGYVRGNLVVISRLANCIKQDAGHSEIRRVADWLEKLA